LPSNGGETDGREKVEGEKRPAWRQKTLQRLFHFKPVVDGENYQVKAASK